MVTGLGRWDTIGEPLVDLTGPAWRLRRPVVVAGAPGAVRRLPLHSRQVPAGCREEAPMKRLLVVPLAVAALLIAAVPALAHVPYLETSDYSETRPFVVRPPVNKSIAAYAWFKTGDDIDVYSFQVTGPTHVYAQAIVPVCPGNERLLPWFALVGPGLPAPAYDVPFDLPYGYGAIVVPNLAPGVTRPQFYELFGGKSYYDGPTLTKEVSTPGTWYIYMWDPYGVGGDYVGVIGDKEIWKGPDILRALMVTPIIRRDGELHRPCP
jgi:hypothetical protein